MNNSPSNIFYIMLFLERYHLNSRVVLAATGNIPGETQRDKIMLLASLMNSISEWQANLRNVASLFFQ